VNVLQRFERRLGGLVEGAFAKVFQSGVEPVEIAGALARECDDRKAIGPARVLVPNQFTVELAGPDYARLEPYAEPLSDELALMVREHADQQHYSFVGSVLVTLERAPELTVGTFRVRSGVRADDIGDDDPPPPLVSLPGPRLVLVAGPPAVKGLTEAGDGIHELRLTDRRVVIGRSPEATLQLADTGVSRRHAELAPVGGAWWVADLGSTNGTAVNGRPVTRAELADGDRLELGTTVLVFRDDSRG
jgi:Protein of unknown function (DUF3662)/Inner membrane component of T3SS, cytoplasmic domain